MKSIPSDVAFLCRVFRPSDKRRRENSETTNVISNRVAVVIKTVVPLERTNKAALAQTPATNKTPRGQEAVVLPVATVLVNPVAVYLRVAASQVDVAIREEDALEEAKESRPAEVTRVAVSQADAEMLARVAQPPTRPSHEATPQKQA